MDSHLHASIDAEKRDALRLIDFVGNAMRDATPGGSFEMGGTDRLVREPVVGMYWRCHRLFRGIGAVVSARVSDDGLILGRALFDQTLRLMELADATDRLGLILRWHHEGLKQDRRLIRLASEVGLEAEPSAGLEAIGRRQSELDQVRSEHGYTTLPKLAAYKALAIRFGLDHDFWTVELMHQYVHGNPLAHANYRQKSDGGKSLAIYTFDTEPGNLRYTAALASKLMLLSHQATTTVMGWHPLGFYTELLEQVQEMLDNPDQGQGTASVEVPQ